MSGEKKRLEQFLLQSRASNIINVDPRFARFQPEQIDTIRLRSAQIEAGKKPVSEKVVKQQQKKKRKARRGKQLRGEVTRAIREQKRFERGERRDRPEQEPGIVGEPRNTGLGYDPDIERRRLDIQEQRLRDENLRVLAQARRDRIAQDRELADRRAARAEARAERAALPPALAPAPIVIPPAQVDIGGIRVEPAQVDIGGIAPVINIPELPARADADPIPEIQRLGAQIRADYNAFGQETRDRNEDVLRQVREQTEAQQLQSADIRQRQFETDQTIREAIQRQDAVNQQIQERIGLGETAMGEARDAVVQEIRDAENRLRGAARELDRPTSYDDVILRAAQREIRAELRTEPSRSRGGSLAEVTPSPSVARPPTPVTPESREPEALLASQTIGGGVIEGGGELQLPSINIPEVRLTTAEEELRLSPVGGGRQYPRGTGGQGPKRGGEGALRLETEETRSQRAARRTPVREEIIESPVATPTPEVEFLPGVQVETPSTREEESVLEELRAVVDEQPLRPVSQRIEEIERVIEPAGIQSQAELRPLDPDVLIEAVEEADQVGQVQDQRAQRIRDSQTIYQDSFGELAGEVRTGPRGTRGQRGGLGYRVRNNTDKPIKRIQPGDVVNVIGVEEGTRGEGRYRLDTQTAAGTRISLDEFGPLVDDGSFLFERGNRHELGGHFDENPYGPPQEPGLLQQGAEAVGGALAAGAGGAARLAGGVAQGVGEGIVGQLPAAGDIGAALGRGAVAGVAGAGRLAAGAAGAVGEAVFGGEEEQELEPESSP